MALPQGIPFRATAAYVTDGADDDSEIGTTNNYPRVSDQGNNVGYESGATTNTRDRNNTYDSRIAGCCFSTGTTKARYRIDMPSSGSKNIRIALGDTGGGWNADCEVFDTTTSLGVIASGVNSAGSRYHDATDVERTNATWPTDNAAVNLTFATTICRFDLGGNVTPTTVTAWAYVYVEDAEGGEPETGEQSSRLVSSRLASSRLGGVRLAA